MPAGPIGACWAAGSWLDTAWEADTWAGASPTPPPYVVQPSQTMWSGGGGMPRRHTALPWDAPRHVKKAPKVAPPVAESLVRRIGLVFAQGAGISVGAGVVTAKGRATARAVGAGVEIGAGVPRVGVRKRLTPRDVDDLLLLMAHALTDERDE